MSRTLALAPIPLAAFVVALALAALAIRAGFVSDDAAVLWAGAITAGEGEVPLGRIVASYPTIPFFATTLLQWIAPAGTPIPALLAAALIALLAALWLHAFRLAGFAPVTAGIAALLLALHPALLRAAMAGPPDILVAIFLFLLAGALYDLRAQCTTPEVMAVGFALLGLSFSHPVGAALAIAAMPFLGFALAPAMIANSALAVVFALIFPALFGAAAFAYLSWVFPGSGWSFFGAQSEDLSTWTAGLSRLFGGGFTGWPPLDAALTIALVLLLGAPLAVFAVALAYRRRPLVAPALVLAATALAAAALSVATGLFGSPAAIAVAAPALAAAVLTRIPPLRERRTGVVALLFAGWLGGLIGVVILDPAGAAQARAAFANRPFYPERADALALGGATIGARGVLVDTDNAPLIVIGRGSARGLIGPADEDFALTLLFAHIDAPFVAVPDPHSLSGAQDRLNKAFPQLYRSGSPRYRLAYQNKTWRLFAHQAGRAN